MNTTDWCQRRVTLSFNVLDAPALVEVLFGQLGTLWAQSFNIDPHWYLHTSIGESA